MHIPNGEYEAHIIDTVYQPGREFTWIFQTEQGQLKKESRLTSEKAQSFLFSEIKKLGFEVWTESELTALISKLKGLKVKLNVHNERDKQNIYIIAPVLSADIHVYTDVPQAPTGKGDMGTVIELLQRLNRNVEELIRIQTAV